jgi:hypothetical protein
MAQPDTIEIPPGAWTLITDTDAARIMFQNVGGAPIYVQGSVGVTPPAALDGGWLYHPGFGQPLASLADLFPGISGANRVWARAVVTSAVEVQHV